MGIYRENMTRENIKPKPGLKSELGPCPAADWTQKVDWNVYLTGENGLTTHCNQIESCGVFLVNGDTLAQINLDHVSNFKEVKNVMPFFKKTNNKSRRISLFRFQWIKMSFGQSRAQSNSQGGNRRFRCSAGFL